MPANYSFIAPLNKYTAKDMDIDNLTVGKAPNTYTLPTADGSANQVLTTDGDGIVSWGSGGGGGGGDVVGEAADSGDVAWLIVNTNT